MIEKDNNGVLGRIGARELTREEIECIHGSGTVHTNTACTFAAAGGYDGDRGECGPVIIG